MIILSYSFYLTHLKFTGLQANDFHEISKRYSLPTKLSHLFINNIYNNNPNLIITSADSIHDENECIRYLFVLIKNLKLNLELIFD